VAQQPGQIAYSIIDAKAIGRFMPPVFEGVQTRAAVVAQIRHEMHIGRAKGQAAGHGGKDSTKAFAIAAGIANVQLAGDFGLGLRQAAATQIAHGQGMGLVGQGL
jgi:hypothetical protein